MITQDQLAGLPARAGTRLLSGWGRGQALVEEFVDISQYASEAGPAARGVRTSYQARILRHVPQSLDRAVVEPSEPRRLARLGLAAISRGP
jgi:hypothetical protein